MKYSNRHAELVSASKLLKMCQAEDAETILNQVQDGMTRVLLFSLKCFKILNSFFILFKELDSIKNANEINSLAFDKCFNISSD